MIKSFIEEFKISSLQERINMSFFAMIFLCWGLTFAIATIEFVYWLGVLITPSEEIQSLVNQYINDFFFTAGA